jgi:hypothetical protein
MQVRFLAALTGAFLVIALGLAGCGPRDAGGAQPTSPPRTSPPASGGGASGPGRASIELSGTVSGPLAVQGISCQPAGVASLIVSISGTTDSGGQYTVDIVAPQPGSYELSADSAATVGLTETRPSFRQWAVGFQQASGSGSLAIEQQSGQVDANLVGVQGALGTVRVNGSWACP